MHSKCHLYYHIHICCAALLHEGEALSAPRNDGHLLRAGWQYEQHPFLSSDYDGMKLRKKMYDLVTRITRPHFYE